ncbi:MAG: beta-glucosidase BglX [Anaerolineae bacterium]
MESTSQIDHRVNDLLAQMTLEEKIGQLTQIGQYIRDSVPVEERIRDGQAGSILWLSDPHEINRLQHIAVEQSRLHIPLLFGLDVIHGLRTIFPPPLAMAASWDPELVEQGQAVAAREARASGINWTFAPMVDMARDPRWGRIVEGAGEDPYLGAAMARAQVRGFQGETLGGADRVLACAKHFAGYGAADGGRDYDSAYIPEALLRNVYLPPFRAALDAGVGTFMSAYMDLNDVPASANPFLLDQVLRREWGFDGFVVSDANAVADLVTHGFARDPQQAALRALVAGVNMDMASRTYLTHLVGEVTNGSLAEATVDNAVRPILTIKMRMGLFENPYIDESQTATVLGAPAHRELAHRAAVRTSVLLCNENALLPLDRMAYRSIAVIGPFADSQHHLSTMWAANDTSGVTTILQGIRARVGNDIRVEYAPGVEIRKQYESMFDKMMGGPRPEPWTETQSQSEFDRAINLAKESDLIILVMGEQSTMSGELASQSSLELPGRQSELIAAASATGKPVVLILVNGRPLNITTATGQVSAILEAWHPGIEGGNAIADLLFGDAVPGGKLPVTWPFSAGQCPIYYAHNLTHQPETAPGFQSRYWDIPSTPLYPFGFGLSYTTFAYSNLQLTPAKPRIGETLSVAVDVTNTGHRSGDEVAQLYIHQRAGSASRPVRELKGFRRITLAPGETRTVHFTLGPAELSYWSTAVNGWVQESETFDLWVGGDSTAPLHGSIQILP